MTDITTHTACDFRRIGVTVDGVRTEPEAIDAAYKHLGLKAYHDVTATHGPITKAHPLGLWYIEFSWDYVNCEACGNPPAMEHLA